MNNGWTGGQYSLFRAVLGVSVAASVVQLLSQQTASGLAFVLSGLLFSLLLAVGMVDRFAAALLGVGCVAYYCSWRTSHDPNLLLVGGLLLAHVYLPRAPYGSWEARGRTDPGAGWRMPPHFFAIAWVVLAVTYACRGFEAIQHSTTGAGLLVAWPYHLYAWMALAFPLLALIRPVRLVRPWLWLVMFLLQILILPTGWEPLSFGLLLLHGFTFDPAWIKPEGTGTEPIFYDGHCGLCHRAVRFVLAEDVNGAAFRFAPLDSDAFRAAVSEEERAKLPDSMVVKTAEGAVLTRSSAFLHILRRLGGLWRMVALVGGMVPRPLRDLVYDGVARVRRRLFASPSDACPVLPKELRQRFDY